MTYANVAATLALLFAMTGGAYAAKRYLISSTKQINPKVLKQLETGRPGPAGPAGAPGPQGVAGKEGEKGAQGVPGIPGIEGKAGTSVGSKILPSGNKNCPAGGSEFKAGASITFGCNGSPWVVSGLPQGASETGVWGIAAMPGLFFNGTQAFAIVPVSFSVPLAAGLEEANVHFIKAGTSASNDPAGCKGTVESPEAESGNLCIFERLAVNVVGVGWVSPETGTKAAGKAGLLLELSPTKATESILAMGVWVVTG